MTTNADYTKAVNALLKSQAENDSLKEEIEQAKINSDVSAAMLDLASKTIEAMRRNFAGSVKNSQEDLATRTAQADRLRSFYDAVRKDCYFTEDDGTYNVKIIADDETGEDRIIVWRNDEDDDTPILVD